MKWVALIFSIMILAPSSFAAEGEWDRVTLSNGSVLEGCVSEADGILTVETLAGVLTIPEANVESVERSKTGASELLLGARLLDRGQYDRARALLKKSRRYQAFRTASAQLLDQLEAKVREDREARLEEERAHIEQVIKRRGLKAGIEELKRMRQEEEEYWGGYRGQLHLAMARERLNHIDLARAERHLVLAEQYGVDPREWETVRNELLDMRRQRVVLGEDELRARLRKRTPPSLPPSDFLGLVRRAEARGEKLPPMQYLQYLDRYARQHSLDPLLVWAMIDVESSWRPKVVSHKGAQGLMQLMPLTAKDLDVNDPFDPQENIRGGTQYMRFLLSMFGDEDTALAAYNMGPGRIERSDGIPNAGQRYIRKVRDRHTALRARFRS